MIFLSIGALAACVACRPTLSVVAQLLGFLTKYTCLLFFPAQLVYLWRSRRSAAQLAAAIAAGLLLVSAVAGVLYAPLWAGVHTFQGVLTRADTVSSATLAGITAGCSSIRRSRPLRKRLRQPSSRWWCWRSSPGSACA